MFNQVTIVGVGLLGGSLARELRDKRLAKRITGVCKTRVTAEYALQNNLVDAVEPLVTAIKGADLVVLATPMQQMIPLLQECQREIAPDTILTDVGSVKTDLYEKLQNYTPGLLSQFVLAHPIAGGENSGAEASQLGLFANKHVIITTNSHVREEMVTAIQKLWQRVGALVKKMSLEEHDAVFAKTSHLPHVVAFSLVNYLNDQKEREQLFDLAAAGFYDFTRIASSNAQMWRDICITNKSQVASALRGYADQIEKISYLIENEDQQSILEYFNAAKSARDAGLEKKKQ